MNSGSGLVVLGPTLAVAVAVLALAAAGLDRAARLGHGRAVLLAVTRATVQLIAVALVISAVIASWPLTMAFVTAMAVVATITAARRLTRTRSGWQVALPVVAGPLAVVVGLVAGGVVPRTGLAVVPTSGILIGGAMTATGLAGRRALDTLATRWDEFEAALSIGYRHRDAVLFVCRDAAAQALVPALDQTRTVGLVTLPGAFVGSLLGGASPLAAGAVQLVVLVALLAVEALAIVLVIELVARQAIWPAPPPTGTSSRWHRAGRG